MADRPLSMWDYLRLGDEDQALARVLGHYRDAASVGNALQIGVFYIFVGRYEDAAEHLRAYARSHRVSSASIHNLLGIAEWCQRRTDAAIASWRQALKAGYADAAGGVRAPLLLYYASIAREGSFPTAEAEGLLEARLRHRRAQIYWPGPLAKLVLGQIGVDDLEAIWRADAARGRNWDYSQRRDTEFYLAAMALRRGDPSEYLRRMERAAVLPWGDLDAERSGFFTYAKSAEFLLGRYELAHFDVGTADRP